MAATPGPAVFLALIALVAVAVAASAIGRLHTGRSVVTAAARAVVQLAVVSLVIAFVLRSLAWSLLFTVVMFAVAVLTTSRRIGAAGAWPYAAAAMACGLVPTLAIIFATRAVPFDGPSLVPFAGIVIGGTVPEALVPGLDQTRTVGLVTLPGAFVGVLLGGGTPVQAGSAQILVLVGLLAAQTVTVAVGYELVRRGRLLPADLRATRWT